ncbi:MAG: 2,4-dihydroxyhept-2-ene-1,7-dioic acid aldolase [Flavobacteriaceae bacterium]|nr:2,4-dihydroxyhept-2-ene-1,7-dioic acid aldolase [Flavobacteriaceae bacterium]
MAINRNLRGDLKRKLSNNNLTLGSWLTINHQSVIEIMATAGFEWLCIDIEHSAISISDVLNLIGHIQGNGMQALVRVEENNPVIIKRVMDAGADGVIIPMVNSVQDAKKAVSSVKYPSIGSRGVGLSRAQNYGTGFSEYKEWLQNDAVIIAQIEHINGVNELSGILDVPGIDGIIVGPYDLSASMGYPGEFDRTDVVEALKRINQICIEKDRPLGFHVISSDHQKTLEKINAGYTFLAVSLDFFFLGDSARKEMEELRKATKS